MGNRSNALFHAFLFLLSCGISGCAGSQSQIATSETVQMVPPPPAQPQGQAERAADADDASLLKRTAYRGFFKDLRAFQVGDLVTINIVETSKASKSAATRTGRESAIGAGIENLLGYETQLKKIFPQDFDNKNMFKASLGSSFDGSGSTDRVETMTAFMTARVMNVTANGNLYIEGRRQIRVNNETQFIILSGLIRPTDISPNNTVLSSYMADAKIEYLGSGPVSDKQRPGWLGRVVDVAWPF
jgi:flagellar L-ring protein precursor FlgH